MALIIYLELGVICLCPGQCLMNLRGEIVGVGAMAVLRGLCQLMDWKMNILALPKKLEIQAIANGADASDLVSSSNLQELAYRISLATAAIINMFDPDVNILGGRNAELDQLYLDVPRK